MTLHSCLRIINRDSWMCSEARPSGSHGTSPSCPKHLLAHEWQVAWAKGFLFLVSGVGVKACKLQFFFIHSFPFPCKSQKKTNRIQHEAILGQLEFQGSSWEAEFGKNDPMTHSFILSTKIYWASNMNQHCSEHDSHAPCFCNDSILVREDRQ